MYNGNYVHKSIYDSKIRVYSWVYQKKEGILLLF
jgi:hypothetical protein